MGMGNLEGIEKEPGGWLFIWCLSTFGNLKRDPIIGIPQLAASMVVVPVLFVEGICHGLLRRVLPPQRRAALPPAAKPEPSVPVSNVGNGVELIQRVFLVHKPEDAKIDVVFFTEDNQSPRPWTTCGDGTFWPGKWLPEDFPEARVLEVLYNSNNLNPWGTGIQIVNALTSNLVGFGSRPFFLVSKDAANAVVAHMIIRDTMRNLLPLCKGVVMYGNTNGNECVEHDYAECEKRLDTLTFINKSGIKKEIGALCSSKDVQLVSSEHDITSPEDKDSIVYSRLISFIKDKAKQ